MQLSSPRFKALAVTLGASFWFFVIITTLGIFQVEIWLSFFAGVFIFTQIFAKKISKGLDKFSLFNTKFFLGCLFIFVVSLYGIFFKLLRIDLLRLQKNENSYWLDIEENQTDNLGKQY